MEKTSNYSRIKDAEYKIRKGNLGDEVYVKDPKLGGYTAFFKDFSNIVTQGETLLKARRNLWNTTYDVLKHFSEKKKE